MPHSLSITPPSVTWRSTVPLLLACLWVLGPSAATSAEVSPTEKAQVEAFSKQGVRAYRAARYGEAIGYFRRAYTIFPEPKLLFNLGRCHQKSGEFDEAIDHFAQVVGDQAAPQALRTRAQTELTVLLTARRMSRAHAKSAAPSKPPAVTRSAEPPAPVSGFYQLNQLVTPKILTPRVRVTRIDPAPVEAMVPPDDGNRGATWALLGIGSATLVAGSIFYALGVSDHGELDDAKGNAEVGLTRVEAIALRDDGANRKTAGVTLLSISGATLLSAMVLFLSADDSAPGAALQVGPMGDGVHAGWGGRF